MNFINLKFLGNVIVTSSNGIDLVVIRACYQKIVVVKLTHITKSILVKLFKIENASNRTNSSRV